MRAVIFAWGVLGVVAVLAQAIARLSVLAWEAIEGGLTGAQWAALAAWVAVSAHAEGWRGFHRGFSPRVVARARWLAAHPTAVRVILAPLFCMALFGASRRGKIRAWIVVVAVAAIVIAVRHVPQPWRGIVDAGVVVGLAIGVVSLAWFSLQALRGRALPVDADAPDDGAPA